MTSNLVSFAASEEQLRDIGIEPWVVGAIGLAILLVLLFALLAFGKGREHS